MRANLNSNFAEEVLTRLKTAKNVVISTHRNPDGDAVGSALGLYHALGQMGIESKVVMPDSFPSFYAWMHGSEIPVLFNKDADNATATLNGADFLFHLDYNGLDRTGQAMGEVLQSLKAYQVMIDHHQEPEPVADVMYCDPTASSTAELVYDFLKELGALESINRASAECLFAGIITDTGSFKYSSTSKHTLDVAADLIDRGVETSRVHELIYDHNSEHRLRLLGFALSKMVVYADLGVAYIVLSQVELRDHNYQKGDAEGLVNYPLSIDGIHFSILVTERDGEIHFSFRSQGDFDVNAFARTHFNGGGHKNAAGGSYSGRLEDGIRRLEDAIRL